MPQNAQSKTVAPTGYHSNYSTGIRAENKVEKKITNEGYRVKQSAGSRGAADLICIKNDRKLYVQVKSSTILKSTST